MHISAPFPKFIPFPPVAGDSTPAKASKVPKVEGPTEAVVQQVTSSNLPKTSKNERKDETIDALLIALTLAVHATRTHPRPALATGRRTSIEDGLTIAKCMDCVDVLARQQTPGPSCSVVRATS
jgi:hypothetical protein